MFGCHPVSHPGLWHCNCCDEHTSSLRLSPYCECHCSCHCRFSSFTIMLPNLIFFFNWYFKNSCRQAVPLRHQGFGTQCLGPGHFEMWPGIGGWTTNLAAYWLLSYQLSYCHPLKLQSAIIYTHLQTEYLCVSTNLCIQIYKQRYSLTCCSRRKKYADDKLIIYQNGKWIKALTSLCTEWAFSKTAEIFSSKTRIPFSILTDFYNLHCEIIVWKDREDLQMSHKVIVYYSCTFTTKYLRKEVSLDKLPGWLCFSLQGHFLHSYLFVSAGMTGAMEQKCWHLVSTNEKWQMHKSFRLCRVEISVWHSLRLLHWWKLPRKAHVTTDVLKRSVLLFKPQTYIIVISMMM